MDRDFRPYAQSQQTTKRATRESPLSAQPGVGAGVGRMTGAYPKLPLVLARGPIAELGN